MTKRNAADGPPSLAELTETLGLNKADRAEWQAKNPPKELRVIPPEPSPVPELPMSPLRRWLLKLEYKLRSLFNA